MARVYNFSAGPAMLPQAVLERAAAEQLDWHGSGMSVMEMSHRGKEFIAIAEKAEADLRALMAIPDHYRVLFLQGGATLQFGAIPLNLAAAGQPLCYLNTGHWSEKAIVEAKRFGEVRVLADTKPSKYTEIPAAGSFAVPQDAAYLHYTPNETIAGVEFPYIPESGAVPLVADLSSTILSRPIEVERFGVIYAGAQKNIGPAGLCLVIVREDLLGRYPKEGVPALLDWQLMAATQSMSNTPPTYGWYIAGLVFEWLLNEVGGLEQMAIRNQRKAEALYDFIDESGFYKNPVAVEARSWMNVPFTAPTEALEKRFIAEAEAEGLTYLAGHRSVGGMRASIYNAMPEAGVAALMDFMREFARKNG